LAKLDTPEADDAITRYCMEGIRLNGTLGTYREATSDITIYDGTTNDEPTKVSIKKGDKVFVSLVTASKDPEMFPDSDEAKVDRPSENYVYCGDGPYTSLGMEASRVALGAMLKTVCKLDGLRRVSGPKGELKKIPL
jgi:linoleate 10R-lipoxygenase